MRLYTCFTPSHAGLLDKLLASTAGKFEVTAREFPQDCPTGEFRSDGWNTTMRKKVELVLEAIEASSTSFVFADADVQFFGADPAAEIGRLADGFDLAAQDDCAGRYCAGLFVCRPSAATRALFKATLDCLPDSLDEQDAMNKCLATAGLRTKMFPHTAVFTLAMGMGWRVWGGEMAEIERVEIPAGLVAHHANWMVGVPRKAAAMDMVRRRVK